VKTHAAIVVAFGVLGIGCGLVFKQSHDYVFGITVAVRDARDAPVSGAAVSMKLGESVFQAVTPVSTAQQLTNDAGGLRVHVHRPSG
jgi:hypothetical protein